MKKVFFFLLLTSQIAVAQNTGISIAGYSIEDGTYNRRGPGGSSTGTFFDKTSWNSSSYGEWHLKNTGSTIQNFRMLIPKGYDPSFNPGYPLLLIFHGAVERANCFDGECYVGSGTFRPTDPLPTPTPSQEALNNLLNNDHHLINGGGAHMNAWNLAGTKKLGDPTLSTRAFPGFVVFPQMWNGWTDSEVTNAIRIVMLLLQEYNIDPNKVYIHGLSNGARGVIRALAQADWLFAAAAPMSPVSGYSNVMQDPRVVNIPTWFFQGGKDDNPFPSETESRLSLFREAGATPRYTLYPTLGHGVWNKAYSEPDFFTWFLTKSKTDIYAKYGNPYICSTNGAPVTLMLSSSFFAYQWEKDGQIIAGATSATYVASSEGVYRARFSRVPNPTESDWDPWSKPFTVSAGGAPPKPELTQNGSIMLRDLNNKNIANLATAPGYNFYQWSRNGTVSTNAVFKNKYNAIFDSTRTSGAYTVEVFTYLNCPSPKSDPKYVFFNNLENSPAPTITAPSGFTGSVQNSTNVVLQWNDVSSQERNYEIWRRRSTDDALTGWTMIALTPEDAVIYNDNNLQAGTEYWYKIRAVSNTSAAARSHYAPGNSTTDPTQSLVLITGGSSAAASPPQNLEAEITDTSLGAKTTTVLLTWSPPAEGTIQGYRVNYGGNSYLTNSIDTFYNATNIPINANVPFTVNTINQASNISAPSNQVSVNTYIDSLFWNHSTRQYTDLTNIPAEEWNNKEFTGRSLNFDLSYRTQDENFLFRFYGYLFIVNGGNYTFRNSSNDGAQVFIDGNSVAEWNSLTPDGNCHVETSTTVALSAGVHTIDIHYWQNQGDMCLGLEWMGPDAGTDLSEFYPLPDHKLRSFDSGNTPPPAPEAPTDLTMTDSTMSTISMSWTFAGTPVPEFEIHRATSPAGPFAIVNRVATQTYTDTGLTPSTTYYYKVRSVNDNGTSEFTPVVEATTTGDDEAPTAPTNFDVIATSFSTATLVWTQSTDNVGVIGYEIYNGSSLAGTTANSTFVVTGLAPGTSYTFKVRAYDASNNFSEYSNTDVGTTTSADTYYSNASGNLHNLTTWWSEQNGTGTNPTSFTSNGLILIVANRTTAVVNGTMTLSGTSSRLIIPAGITLTVQSAFNGQMEVQGNATIILDHTTVPTFASLSNTSTVQYNVATNIPATSYGNLVIGGASEKIFASGTTTVTGNLTVANGASFRGTGNSSIVSLSGDLVYQGTPVVNDLGIELNLVKNGTQAITAPGTVSFLRLRNSPATNIIISAPSVRLGTINGGGLSLSANTTLDLGANTLILAGAGTINSGAETGRIATNNATLDLASSSSSNSNLYFDPAAKTLAALRVNFSGSGDVNVNSAVTIIDALKVTRGDVNANGNIFLESTEAKTANIEEIENNGRIIGAVHVKRYIKPNGRIYRYISSAVENVSVADLQNSFTITGTFGGASSGNQSFWYWGSANAYVAYPTSTNQELLERGRGYSAFMYKTDGPTIINTTGTPYQGAISFPGINSNPTNDPNSGYSLVGNPYASTIAWSMSTTEWPRNNISSVISVRENNYDGQDSNQFRYYDAATQSGNGLGAELTGGKIAPGQAFWVRSTGAGASLSITESAKIAEQQTMFREGESVISKATLVLTKGTKADPAYLALTSFGTDGFDPVYDGPKQMNSNMFNFSTLDGQNNWALAVNNSSDSFCNKTIKLNLQNVSTGEYTLRVEDPETLFGVGAFQVVDKFTNTTFDLRSGDYSFTVTTDPASSGSNRLELLLSRPEIKTDVIATASVVCGQGGKVELANTQKGATYTLMNLANREIATAQTSLGESLAFNLESGSLNEGINDIKVVAGFKGCNSITLPNTVTINYQALPNVTASDVATCTNEPAQLTATSTSSGVTYNWYTATNEALKGSHEAILTTAPILEETYYTVAAVLPNGCEGPRATIVVYPYHVEEPTIIINENRLSTAVIANEYIWSRNGQVIVASAENSLMVNEPGTYEVTAKAGGCAKTSKAFLVTGTEGDQDFRYNVYPNPTASNEINLQVITGNNEPIHVRMVDLVGKEVYGKQFFTDDLKEGVKLSTATKLRAGAYIVILEQRSRSRKVKLIVKE